MSNKVYVIMVGRYEDMDIYKIFPNLKRAKKQLGRMPKGFSCPRIRVYELGELFDWDLQKEVENE